MATTLPRSGLEAYAGAWWRISDERRFSCSSAAPDPSTSSLIGGRDIVGSTGIVIREGFPGAGPPLTLASLAFVY
jgi:hypothetical protein